MAASKKQCFFVFSVLTESSPTVIKVEGLQMTINFPLM